VFLSIIFDASVFLVRLMDEYELKEGKKHLKLSWSCWNLYGQQWRWNSACNGNHHLIIKCIEISVV